MRILYEEEAELCPTGDCEKFHRKICERFTIFGRR